MMKICIDTIDDRPILNYDGYNFKILTFSFGIFELSKYVGVQRLALENWNGVRVDKAKNS